MNSSTQRKTESSSSEKSEGQFLGMGELLSDLSKEVEELAHTDVSTVGSNLRKLVEERVTSQPYQTLATLAAIGFGVGGLGSDQFKHGAIRIGKLIAMKALSGIDADKPSSKS